MAELQLPADGQAMNGPPPENLATGLGSKRQRRPSVRLGDIGEQSAAAAAISYDAFARRGKQWKIPSADRAHLPKEPVGLGKGSKTRPLMTLGNGDCHETLEGEEKTGLAEGNLDSMVGVGLRKPKDSKVRRGGGVLKRPRTNWVSRVEEGAEIADEKLSGEEEEFRDFDPDGSESPLRESPIRSQENLGIDRNHDRRLMRARVSESRDHEAIELDVPSDNTDGRDWKCGTSVERNGGSDKRGRTLEDGVRMWLNGLGLGRYAPVFEIHEVDEEVLPLLTLEDLKDMGINAVGSRRKMFAAIQKLGRGFS
ncbi:uncharacterized protein [Aristolochia californica]|uniref:uncharacterized protein isoform X1 n=2 Tax=Aristolochia californica TaxID=171875 RepID=UPI0035D535A4